MTELAKRGSLYTVLHSDTPLTQELRNRLALESARGLLHLHESGFVHRDIKSPNVLVTEDWHAKLADFGLAKARTETKTTTKSSTATSLRWSAPEVLSLKPQFSTASDVFSFGVLLFELATRQVLPVFSAFVTDLIALFCSFRTSMLLMTASSASQ